MIDNSASMYDLAYVKPREEGYCFDGTYTDPGPVPSEIGAKDKWIDIKESLPLLGRKKWYSKTKHGYARGWEPVKYVENIRKYYDLLVWNDVRQNGGPQQQLIRTEVDQISVPGF